MIELDLPNGRTDGRTDTPAYRDARTHLKSNLITWVCSSIRDVVEQSSFIRLGVRCIWNNLALMTRESKFRKYEGKLPIEVGLIPLVVTTFGAWEDDAHANLKEMVPHQGRNSSINSNLLSKQFFSTFVGLSFFVIAPCQCILMSTRAPPPPHHEVLSLLSPFLVTRS